MTEYGVTSDGSIKIEKFDKEAEKNMFEALYGQNDFTCVLISSAFIDKQLQILLKRYFIKASTTDRLLKQDKGLFGNFRNRIDIAYVSGLIFKNTTTQLINMAEIRNKFAHNYTQTTFEDEDISKYCDSIRKHRKITQYNTFHNDQPVTYNMAVNREAFIVNTVLIKLYLEMLYTFQTKSQYQSNNVLRILE